MRKGNTFLTIIMIIALAVMGFSGYKLFGLYRDYKQGSDEYSSLADKYASKPVTNKPELLRPETSEETISIGDLISQIGSGMDITEENEPAQSSEEAVPIPAAEDVIESSEAHDPDVVFIPDTSNMPAVETSSEETLSEETSVSKPVHISFKKKDPVIPPLTINFDGLKSENEDVTGWIYIEAIPDINYPIVKGRDNQEYLHTTYKKESLFVGSIFEDCENSAEYNDPHTIIYGHNMKDGSMFGKLKSFVNDPTVIERSRYFWILTPEADYRYEIFYTGQTKVNSSVYTLFKHRGPFFWEWKWKMARHILEGKNVPDIIRLMSTPVVTLSTCTGDNSNRFIVQGYLTDIVPK